jgi:hypothetical protein
MHLPKLYDASGYDARVRYAIATILRGRVVNEGGFLNCFEMSDRDQVIRTILRRGLRNRTLRAALEASPLINLTEWLLPYPDLWEAYHETPSSERPRRSRSERPRRSRRVRGPAADLESNMKTDTCPSKGSVRRDT